MSVKLTQNQIDRIILVVGKQFPLRSSEYYVGNQEFFWAGNMKPERFDVKLGWSLFDDCFVAWDYKNDHEAEKFITYCMEKTTIAVKAKVEDHGIYVLWQDKWRFIKEYYPKRSIPAAKTCIEIQRLFKLNAGIPSIIEVILDFSL